MSDVDKIVVNHAKARFYHYRLLEIDLPSGMQRFCNMGEGDYQDEYWVGGFEGGGTTEQEGGGMDCAFSLFDKKLKFRADFISRAAQRCAVKMWEGDGENFLLRFDGFINGYSVAGQTINVDARSGMNRVVDVRVRHPFVKYVTPAGTIINVGGETVIIGREN